jgi:hypothetical protein
MQDQLNQLFTYKTLHTLCSVTKQGKMTAVFYVICMVYGRKPLWSVWSVRNGKFQHWAASREQAEQMHPSLSWRKVMARWQLFDDADADADSRRKKLAVELAPLPEEEGSDKVWDQSMVARQ